MTTSALLLIAHVVHAVRLQTDAEIADLRARNAKWEAHEVHKAACCDHNEQRVETLEREVATLRAELAHARAYIEADADGHCLPECDSLGHAEHCPYADAVENFARVKAENAALRAELAMTRIVAASHDAELGARAGRTCPSCVYGPHCVIRFMAGDTEHPFGCTAWDARPEALEEGA